MLLALSFIPVVAGVSRVVGFVSGANVTPDDVRFTGAPVPIAIHAAGTQALLMGPWTVVAGEVTGTTRDVLMSLAWVINAVVAERIIRRGAAAGPVTPRAEALALPA